MEAVDGFAFQRLGGPAGRNRIAAELFYRITAKLVFPFFFLLIFLLLPKNNRIVEGFI